MKNLRNSIFALLTLALVSCQPMGETKTQADKFENLSEQFADLKIVRYQIPGWDSLAIQQKEMIYYLTEAGLAGRDMMYDQNYRHNLEIRKAMETIVENFEGDKTTNDWNEFMIYTKRMWFSNGIHHHYSMNKLTPDFSRTYFESLLTAVEVSISNEEVFEAIFNPEFDQKKVNLDPSKDLILGSAVNFYGPNVTEADVDAFYSAKMNPADTTPISYGLNSRLVKSETGEVSEEVYKVGGKYGAALEQVNYWLSKAADVAENQAQGDALRLLVDYYNTGDLKVWDAYNIAWCAAIEGDIDYIQGFVEVYNDPKGYRGSYESIVQIKDFDASARMEVLQNNVQWFEDNSSILPEHKKEKVKGVTYKVVNVAGEAGDASPSTPIGVNLPNANWIRSTHGSKSVSLGNIVAAYAGASGSGFLKEFAFSKEEMDRSKKYGKLGGKLHTALHEVVGHASGVINPGVGTPKETLKNYASTLEEGRADLVALYYLMDEQMVAYGLMESLEVGKAEYDSYIRNGMMAQLRRLEPGDVIEEAHMRNRQLVASWAYERGQEENVIEKVVKEGKTFFVVRDYMKLRVIFGELLREIQRIKSEGDYEAGRNLVEDYGVQVDQDIHTEVLARAAKLESAPYGGFINPVLVPVTENGKITDVKVEYPNDFVEQMMNYGANYSFL
ncbi:MAG: dipeptidyl-peptidase-3 [Flavobacteriales bacterium]|jgi:dipeptidyl-peptidase-3